MEEYLNPDSFPDLISRLKKVEEAHLKAQYQFKEGMRQSIISESGVLSDAEHVYQHILKNYGRIQNLREYLEKYFEESQQILADGKNSADALAAGWSAFLGSMASLGSDSGVDYSKYPHAQEYLTREKTMTEEFNETWAYFNSEEYQKLAESYWMPSEYSNYKLLLDGLHDTFLSGFDHEYKLDKYTDALMASSLRGILEGLPDSTPRFKSAEDMYSYLDSATGMSGWKKFISVLKQYLDNANKDGREIKYEMLGQDPDFKTYLKEYDLDIDDFDTGLAGNILSHMGSAAKVIGKAAEAAEYVDIVVECALILKSNYDKQAAYLQSAADALSAAGMYQGSVKRVIDDCLRIYSSQEAVVWDKVYQFIEGKVTGKLTGTVVDVLNEGLPGLKVADIVLKTIDKTYDFVYAKEISASKTLAGCIQYDRSLSATYDHYIDMMKAGVATDEDMQKAEAIYEILEATKEKERAAIEQMKKSYSEMTKPKDTKINGVYWNDRYEGTRTI